MSPFVESPRLFWLCQAGERGAAAGELMAEG